MTPSVTDPAIESFISDSQTKVEAPVVENVAPVAAPVQAEPVKVEIPATETAPKAEVPVVETPKVEVPVVEPIKIETPTIDLEKIFSDASGGKVKSAEELSKILKEHNEFKERIEKSPEMDDLTLKFNSWIKKGYDPELFLKINNLPLDEMSAEDKMKASLAISNPEWTSEDVNLYVKHTYGLMSEDEDGYDAQKLRIGKLKLQSDSRSHEENLRKLQEMTVYSNKDEQEAVKFEGERKSTWQQNLPKIVNDINTIPFTLDDKGTVFNYVPTPLQRQAVMNAVQSAVLNAPVAYDEKGIKAVTDLINKEFINQNINQIVRAAASQQKSIEVEKKIVEAHNPSGMVTPVVTPKVEKSRDDVLFDVMMDTVSGRR